MTRKDFNAFADAIANIADEDDRKMTCDKIGLVCAKPNPRFDLSKWEDACNCKPNE